MISFLGKGSNESDDFSESNDEFSGELVSTLVPSPGEKAIFVREGMVEPPEMQPRQILDYQNWIFLPVERWHQRAHARRAPDVSCRIANTIVH